MPIIPNAPPMASLVELAPYGPRAVPSGAKEVSSDPVRLLAHRAFVMTANAAADGAAPAAEAVYVGWRYLVDSSRGPGIATVSEDLLRQRHVFAAHDRGGYAVAAPRTIQALSEHAGALPKNYELRFLGVPALYLQAVWLKDLDGDEDLLCPFGPTPEGISDDLVYSIDSWVAAVRPIAIRTLAVAAAFEQRQ